MNNVMGISELSMINDMRQLDMISHNIANVTTNGYKRNVAVAGTFVDQLEANLDAASGLFNRENRLVPELRSAIDHTQGAFRKTGNSLDLALEGAGFFALNAGNQIIFSRQGAFHLDGLGRLVSSDNLPVVGHGGEIRLLSNAPRIDQQGMIWDGEDAVAQLKIIEFSNPSDLIKTNGGYLAGDTNRVHTVLQPSVRQGFLETSNVGVMDEMVNMMITVRHFEATQHVIQGYDGMLSTAIQTIAEF